MLRFAQHDIDEVARIATQPLKGEDVSKLTAGDKSISVLLSSPASPRASLCYCQHQKNVGLGLTVD